MNFNRGGPRNFGAPREMHKATCADCGKETEVPFKPTEGRPVYCRDCYQKHRNSKQAKAANLLMRIIG